VNAVRHIVSRVTLGAHDGGCPADDRKYTGKDVDKDVRNVDRCVPMEHGRYDAIPVRFSYEPVSARLGLVEPFFAPSDRTEVTGA